MSEPEKSQSPLSGLAEIVVAQARAMMAEQDNLGMLGRCELPAALEERIRIIVRDEMDRRDRERSA